MNTDFEILPITQAIISFALAYLIGSIPMGFIVARIAAGMDIREHGSGNIGLTNVIRTLGWGPGIITGVLDFLKGYIPVILVITSFSPRDFGSVAAIYELIVIIASLLLILGNLFPVYLLFKGGKGVATGLGVLSALMGVYVFIPLAVFGIFIGFFRFVSIASMAAALSAPLAVVFLKPYITFTQESTSAFIILLVFTSAVALLVIWR
ncbi:MAG TPA: glycerol-3-phosphate acyltransferase, partial [bacterium]